MKIDYTKSFDKNELELKIKNWLKMLVKIIITILQRLINLAN